MTDKCDRRINQIKAMLEATLIAWEAYARIVGRHGTIEDFLKRAGEFHIR